MNAIANRFLLQKSSLDDSTRAPFKASRSADRQSDRRRPKVFLLLLMSVFLFISSERRRSSGSGSVFGRRSSLVFDLSPSKKVGLFCLSLSLSRFSLARLCVSNRTLQSDLNSVWTEASKTLNLKYPPPPKKNALPLCKRTWSQDSFAPFPRAET